jgi:Uma2 family endonuclease
MVGFKNTLPTLQQIRVNTMNEVIEFENGILDEERRDMPSKKHSMTQTSLTVLFGTDERFTTFVELSLDATSINLSQFDMKAKDELIPDISVYSEALPFDDKLGSDEVRVTQMPDLAVEVLSPSQTLNELLNKMEAFFALGVKSCWLAMPSLEVVRVFSQPLCYKDFNMNDMEVIDDVMDIRLPIQKVFKWRSKAV